MKPLRILLADDHTLVRQGVRKILEDQEERSLAGKIGEISAISESSFRVTAQGGAIEVVRALGADGKKVSGGEFARANGLSNGAVLGS